MEQFLAFAVGQVRRRLVTSMDQWVLVTDGLIAANGYPVLDGVGTASHDTVEELVSHLCPRYVEARRQRDYDESWQVETADISKLLAIEKSIKPGTLDADAA